MLLDVVAHWHKVTTVSVITLCSLVTIQTTEAVVRVSNFSHWKTLRTGRVTVHTVYCIILWQRGKNDCQTENLKISFVKYFLGLQNGQPWFGPW